MNVSHSIQSSFIRSLAAVKSRKDISYLAIIVLALVAFEFFNFSTTDYALSDLLGDKGFLGIRWATLLALAFCGIDFAGIARLFNPRGEKDASRSTWYMFGAWFLAATMNAILTWWGVLMSMQTHPILSSSVVSATFVNDVVPIFIALMVWVIRVLLIGSLSRKSDQIIKGSVSKIPGELSRRELRQAQSRAAHPAQSISSRPVPSVFSPDPAGKRSQTSRNNHPEPTYIPMQEEVQYYTMKGVGVEQRRR